MTARQRDTHLTGATRNGQPRRLVSSGDAPWIALAAGVALHLVAVHLDAFSPATATVTERGLGLFSRNFVVAAALPGLLAAAALHLGAAKSAALAPRWWRRAYAATLLVTALGAAWSPYRVAAVKMLAYVASYGALYAAWAALLQRRRDAATLGAAWASAAGLVVAAIVTVLLGNPYGEKLHRFTTLTAPQSFGLALPPLLALLLVGARRRRLASGAAAVLGGALLVGSQLNGSRQGFFACAALLAISALPSRGRSLRESVALPLAAAASAAAITALLRLGGPAPLVTLLDEHGVVAMLTFTPDAFAESGDAGTTRDRLKVWAALARRMERAGPRELMIGHGTSSAAVVIAEHDVRYRGYTAETMDANRTAHNEFLRCAFEGGAFGLAAFCVLAFAPLVTAARRLLASRSADDLLVLAAVGVVTIAYPMLGNLLASAATPVGAALVLLLADLYAEPRSDGA